MDVPRQLRRRTPRRWAECPDDLHDYVDVLGERRRDRRAAVAVTSVVPSAAYSWSVAGRMPKDDLSDWIVTDDWPRPVPVTAAEVAVFEAWFGDVFDELFGPCE